MSKKFRRVNVYNVDEGTTKDIQEADYDYQICNEVIFKILNTHKNDEDASILTSPLFTEYQKMAVSKKTSFETKKTALINNYIPKEIVNRVKTWSLDYLTSELTVVLQ